MGGSLYGTGKAQIIALAINRKNSPHPSVTKGDTCVYKPFQLHMYEVAEN